MSCVGGWRGWIRCSEAGPWLSDLGDRSCGGAPVARGGGCARSRANGQGNGILPTTYCLRCVRERWSTSLRYTDAGKRAGPSPPAQSPQAYQAGARRPAAGLRCSSRARPVAPGPTPAGPDARGRPICGGLECQGAPVAKSPDRQIRVPRRTPYLKCPGGSTLEGTALLLHLVPLPCLYLTPSSLPHPSHLPRRGGTAGPMHARALRTVNVDAATAAAFSPACPDKSGPVSSTGILLPSREVGMYTGVPARGPRQLHATTIRICPGACIYPAPSTCPPRSFPRPRHPDMALATKLKAPNGRAFTLPTGLFINNEFVKAASGRRLASVSPTSVADSHAIPPLRGAPLTGSWTQRWQRDLLSRGRRPRRRR